VITPAHYLILAGILFSLGVAGVLIRRHILMILLSVELMLNAANLVLITGSAVHGEASGQVIAFFIMVVAAVEVTIGLAIAVLIFRKKDTTDTEALMALKG